MAAWLAAIGGVVASWIVAAGFLVGELIRDWNQPGHAILSDCMAVLRGLALGHHGVLIQIGLLVLATLAVVAVAVLVGRLGRSLLRARASTHDHARAARLAGRHIDRLAAVVLDAPQPLAYCVPGHPSTIVVTRLPGLPSRVARWSAS